MILPGIWYALLFCNTILYCRLWLLVFSLQTSTFVSLGFISVPICLPICYANNDMFFIASPQDS